MKTQIESDRNTIESLIPEEIASHRPKRFIFGWIGQAIGSVFGLSSRDQIREVEKSVEELRLQTSTNRAGIVENQKLLLALTEIVDNSTQQLAGRIDRAQTHLKKMSQVVNNLTFALTLWNVEVRMIADFAKQTRMLLHKLSLHAGLELQALALVRQRSRELVAAAQKIMNHRLPTDLVSPSLLKKMLRSITKAITRNHGGYQLVYKDPEYYYTAGEIEYKRRGRSLVVALNIPVTRIDTLFTIYEIHSYIAPVEDSKNASKIVGTQVENLSDMFAVSHAGSYYIEMDRHKWLECVGTRVKICPNLPPLREKTIRSCSLALFEGIAKEVTQECDVVYYPKLSHIPPQIISLGGGEYIIVSKSKTWIKTCQNHAPVSVHTGLHNRVKLECDCSLTMEGLYLPPNLENCDGETIFAISEINNFPFVNAFKNISETQFTVEEPLSERTNLPQQGITIPQLKIYEPEEADIGEDLSKFKVKLTDAVRALKSNEPLFLRARDRVEYLTRGNRLSLTEKMVAILALYSAVASSIGLIIILYSWRNRRGNVAIPIAAGLIQTAQAARDSCEGNNFIIPLEIVECVMILMFIIYALYCLKKKSANYLIKRYHFFKIRHYAFLGHKDKNKVDVVVEFGLGKAKAWIYVGSMPINPAVCSLEGDLNRIVQEIDNSGHNCMIKWNFKDINLVEENSSTVLLTSLPSSYVVSEKDRWIVHYYNHPNFTVNILAAGRDGMITIPKRSLEVNLEVEAIHPESQA